MNNATEDELIQRREQAIKDDKAYGKTRLKEEFRVKPKPGILVQ